MNEIDLSMDRFAKYNSWPDMIAMLMVSYDHREGYNVTISAQIIADNSSHWHPAADLLIITNKTAK